MKQKKSRKLMLLVISKMLGVILMGCLLFEINWTDYELPNGLCWHLEHFKKAIENGGYSFGCFDNGALVGYGTLDTKIFGEKSKYVLLDQLFVSKDYRNRNIGKQIVSMCAE